MGYHTEFDGKFTITPTLTPEHKAYLEAFNETRRMKRSSGKAMSLPDPRRQATGLPIGQEGCYFVGAVGFMGQDSDVSVLNYNSPPAGQPGLWCQWRPNTTGTAIVWDGGEKFYDYVEWAEYLIANFLARSNGRARSRATWAAS